MNTKFKVGQEVMFTRTKYVEKYCECCGFYNEVANEIDSQGIVQGIQIAELPGYRAVRYLLDSGWLIEESQLTAI